MDVDAPTTSSSSNKRKAEEDVGVSSKKVKLEAPLKRYAFIIKACALVVISDYLLGTVKTALFLFLTSLLMPLTKA